MSRHRLVLDGVVASSLLLTLSSSASATSPKQPSQEQPFTGTITYTSTEPAGDKTTWKLVTDGRQHGVTFEDEKRWFGADGSRFRQGRKGYAEPDTSEPMVPAASTTALPKRMIAGREATCLTIVPKEMPAFQPRTPDRLEACLYDSTTSISFTIFGGMVDADIDAAFAAQGHHGVPASAALVGKQGVFASWTATKIDTKVPSAQALKKDVFLTFAATASPKDRCALQLETGRALVKAAMIAQESNRAETDVYVMDLEKVGFVNTAPALYTVKVEKVTATGYVIVADGIGEAKGDQWRIDEQRTAEHTKTAPCR